MGGQICSQRDSVVVAYRVECASDTLREADNDSQQGIKETLKDEGNIDERRGRHRGKLEGGSVGCLAR